MFEQIKLYDLIFAIMLFLIGFVVDVMARIYHSKYYDPKFEVVYIKTCWNGCGN
jgi:hypothetical protein